MAHGGRAPHDVPAVVLDTNVYVSAFLFGGAPGEVVSLGRRGRLDVYLSSALWHELYHVLREKFRWAEQQISDVRADLDDFVHWAEPTERVTVFKEKHDADNRVLEIAAVKKADAIVTGDRQVLNLRRFHGIPIRTPRGFLDWYERLAGT